MLQIIYKNGTIRNINVKPNFFISDKTKETISKSAILDKVTDLCSDLGPYREIYHVTLYVGSQLITEIGPNLHNKPFELPVEEKIDYPAQVKDMKKDTKGFVYTQRILRNADGVTVTPIKEAA